MKKQILKLRQHAKCLNKTWVLRLHLIMNATKMSIFLFVGYLFSFVTMLLENMTAKVHKVILYIFLLRINTYSKSVTFFASKYWFSHSFPFLWILTSSCLMYTFIATNIKRKISKKFYEILVNHCCYLFKLLKQNCEAVRDGRLVWELVSAIL